MIRCITPILHRPQSLGSGLSADSGKYLHLLFWLPNATLAVFLTSFGKDRPTRWEPEDVLYFRRSCHLGSALQGLLRT